VAGVRPILTERDILKVWFKAHATRLYAVLSVAVVVTAHYRPGIPVDAVLTGAGALLGVGEAAQRAAKSIAKGVPVAKRKP
jgi:hypothetical protein